MAEGEAGAGLNEQTGCSQMSALRLIAAAATMAWRSETVVVP